MRITLELVDSVKKMALSKWVGLKQSVESLNRTKRPSKNSFCLALFELGTLVFYCSQIWTWTKNHITGSSDFWPLALD